MPDGNRDQLLTTLQKKTSAEVYYDNFNRGRYATDASIYQMMPYGVLIPKTKFDLIDTFEIECKEVATKNADDSMNNAFRLLLILEALGPFSSKDELETRLDSLNEDEQKN